MDNQTCECPKCTSKRNAVRRLVDSFSNIAADWLVHVLDALGESAMTPMWGTCFIVENSTDVRSINNLLTSADKNDGVDEEEEALQEAGWCDVTDTGLLAREVDGELVIGVHGAGYCFYDAHWEPLYDALGYKWHE